MDEETPRNLKLRLVSSALCAVISLSTNVMYMESVGHIIATLPNRLLRSNVLDSWCKVKILAATPAALSKVFCGFLSLSSQIPL
jgi:hypothetical protein